MSVVLKTYSMNGFEGEIKIELPFGSIILGRSSTCDLRISDCKCSKKHCSITWNHEKIIVKDLDSRNGTFINGFRVNSSFFFLEDQLKIGDTLIVIDEITLEDWEKGLLNNLNKFKGTGISQIGNEVFREFPYPQTEQERIRNLPLKTSEIQLDFLEVDRILFRQKMSEKLSLNLKVGSDLQKRKRGHN